MTYSRRDFLAKTGSAVAGGAALLALSQPSHSIALESIDRPADRVLSGNESFPDGFKVPHGEVWEFDPSSNTTVESGGNVVVRGVLRMKPASDSVVHKLRFVGVDEGDFQGGGMTVKESDVGLWVMGFGRLRIVGSRKSAWTRIGEPTNWKASDSVIVCPVRPGKWAPDHFESTTWGNFERPDPVIIDGDEYHAEVLNMERNVIIEGTPGGRSHCLIKSKRRQIIKYAHFRHMGVPGKAGRYPVHFHHCMDGSRGSLVIGCLVSQSGHRAYVTHASHGVRVAQAVAYEVEGNPYWWDKREYDSENKVDRSQANDSHDIVWNRCVAANVTKGQSEGFLAGFTLGGGSNNKATNCVAVGINGSNDAAGYEWPSQSNKPPNHWEFRNNRAHNNKGHGIYIWQNSGSPHVVEDTVLYNNGEAGVLHGAYGNKYQWVGLKIFGSEAGVRLYATTNAVEDKHRGDPNKAQVPQAWKDIHIEQCGVGLAISHAKGGDGETAVTFEDLRFEDCEAIVVRTTNKDDKKPRLIDIIEPTVDGNMMTEDMIDINGALAGSVVRVQNRDGSAFEVRHNGESTSIPPFSS